MPLPALGGGTLFRYREPHGPPVAGGGGHSPRRRDPRFARSSRRCPAALRDGSSPCLGGAGEAVPAPRLRVSLIGDSVAASVGASLAARQQLAAYDLAIDARVCRRTAAPSCPWHGEVAPTVRDVVAATPGDLGDVVVLVTGYNDDPRRFDRRRHQRHPRPRGRRRAPGGLARPAGRPDAASSGPGPRTGDQRRAGRARPGVARAAGRPVERLQRRPRRLVLRPDPPALDGRGAARPLHRRPGRGVTGDGARACRPDRLAGALPPDEHDRRSGPDGPWPASSRRAGPVVLRPARVLVDTRPDGSDAIGRQLGAGRELRLAVARPLGRTAVGDHRPWCGCYVTQACGAGTVTVGGCGLAPSAALPVRPRADERRWRRRSRRAPSAACASARTRRPTSASSSSAGPSPPDPPAVGSVHRLGAGEVTQRSGAGGGTRCRCGWRGRRRRGSRRPETARSGSPGQPITASRSAARHRPAAAARPRAGHDPGGRSPRTRDWPPRTPAEPDCRVGLAAPGRGHAAPGASGQSSQRGARGRQRSGAEVEHRLVPRPRLARAAPRRRPPPAPRSAVSRRPADAGQHPGHVGVDDGDVALEGEGQHRPGRVRPDAGQRAGARRSVDGKTPPCWSTTAVAAAVQVDRPAVVAEAGPRRPRRRRRGAAAHAGGGRERWRGTRGSGARPAAPASAGASAR